MTRLNLLRLGTMPGFDPDVLGDVSKLKKNRTQSFVNWDVCLSDAAPQGESGFSRITGGGQRHACRAVARDRPEAACVFRDLARVTNEVYYIAQKVARFLGTNNVDNAARLSLTLYLCRRRQSDTPRRRQLYGHVRHGLIVFGANPANDQPVMTKYLHEAKNWHKNRAGNPYDEPAMKQYWVRPRPTARCSARTSLTTGSRYRRKRHRLLVRRAEDSF